MESLKTRDHVPQAGREEIPQSRTALAVGPTDSGGGPTSLSEMNMEDRYADYLAGINVMKEDGKKAFRESAMASRTLPDESKVKRQTQKDVQLGPEELVKAINTETSSQVSMRQDNEDLFAKCRIIIGSMKRAIGRQRNISMEVKDGLFLLEETIELIAYSEKKEELGINQTTQTSPAISLNRTAHNSGAKTPKIVESGKRAASSPPENEEGDKRKKAPGTSMGWVKVERKKKMKIDNGVVKETEGLTDKSGNKDVKRTPGGFMKEIKKKKKQKKRHKPRPAAILVRPAGDVSYADILREMKSKTRPEDSGTEIKTIRQTRAGGMLMELKYKNENKGSFCDAVKLALGEKAVVTTLETKCTLEIRDLDCLVDENEIQTALKQAEPDLAELKVKLTSENSRRQKAALVTINERAAKKLLDIGRIKIGWIYCRIRKRTEVERCFHCLGFGHIAATCKGPDRTKVCYRCGKLNHKAKQCSESVECVLCKDRGEAATHFLGSGRCGAFREELTKARGVTQRSASSKQI